VTAAAADAAAAAKTDGGSKGNHGSGDK
jgi:hypothetical protein